jgi:hypothetical protein
MSTLSIRRMAKLVGISAERIAPKDSRHRSHQRKWSLLSLLGRKGPPPRYRRQSPREMAPEKSITMLEYLQAFWERIQERALIQLFD